jgi:glutamate/tyrosine decarboxylase-like PLP-dependent enzyme
LNGPLPEEGTDPATLLADLPRQLFDHSLFNAHPRFFGYITAPAAPIGILADFLASALNANVGAWRLGPAATEIETQTVRWIAELIGYPSNCAAADEQLDRVQRSGEAFVSNAVVHGRYVLRACIVNFHTERQDVEALLEIVARLGRKLDRERRPASMN